MQTMRRRPANRPTHCTVQVALPGAAFYLVEQASRWSPNAQIRESLNAFESAVPSRDIKGFSWRTICSLFEPFTTVTFSTHHTEGIASMQLADLRKRSSNTPSILHAATQGDESIVVDGRSALKPAEQVERKLSRLLRKRGSAVPSAGIANPALRTALRPR